MGDPRHMLGIAAEQAVGDWLEASGWRVLGRRVRSRDGGEVDIVALDPAGILVGIEVRARRTVRTGTGTESITAGRVRRAGRTVVAFAAATGVDHRGLRLDLVRVVPEPGPIAGRWQLHRTPGIGW
ncbi:MAG TPA: YraN family protein [Candidatus Limnocylindrales bacterium]|nr:YraN family protein [Candidatus Limnocylindrales bacterium]